MMQAVLEDAERVDEHVLNFKGHRVLDLTLMADYFSLNALFVDNFRWRFCWGAK